MAVACGGAPFTTAELLPPLDDAGAMDHASPPPSEGGDEAATPAVDAPTVPDGPNVVDAGVDVAAPDVAKPPPAIEASIDAPPDAMVCDLKPCMCGAHVALCCDGPCPTGFEGLSCYCGDCRFPTQYVPDAGRCE